ncbi:MAG: hypothetical protein ACT4P3_02210 [Betaproteobacteria bacterium]
MNERWVWSLRYAIVIVLALVLAAALGEMDLFKATRFGKSGLNAARIVQFLGFGGALLVFWLLARRAALLIEGKSDFRTLVKALLVPLATLIVVACAHAVGLLVLGPLMSKTWHQIYNWAFIAAIILSAAWLVAALFTGSASLAPLFPKGAKPTREAPKDR